MQQTTPGQTKEVQQFISDLFTLGSDKAEIVAGLYNLFKASNSTFTDKFIYGGIGIYLVEELIGGIYVSKNHVSLVFSDGYKLSDPDRVLEGSGQFRRHIKVKNVVEIQSKNCAKYIKKLFELYS